MSCRGGKPRPASFITARPGFLLALGVLLLVGLSGLLLWWRPGLLPRPENGLRDAFSAAEIGLIQPGDIVLRRGVGLPSDLVVSLLHDGTGLSHAAMVLEQSPHQDWILVQSINASLSGIDGVQTQRLSDFFRYDVPGSLVLVRPDWSPSQREAGLAAARQALAKHLPFDNSYDAAEHTALYCTELVVLLLHASGWWQAAWTIWQGQFISFASFLQPDHFTVLVDHRPH